MRRSKSFLCALGILALPIFLPLSALAAPAGNFTYIEGRVDVTSPGERARPAHLGDEVHVGDIVRAKSLSRAEITFVDGNVLRLAQNTRVEVTEYVVGKEETRGTLKLFRGKIQNIVKTVLGRIFGRGKKNRFEVHTPTAVCGVRGTKFFTWYTNGVSGAAFQEGKGYVYNVGLAEEVKNIMAGERMLVLGPGQPPIVMFASDFELQQHLDDTRPEKPEKEDRAAPLGEEPPPDTGDANRLMREPDPVGHLKNSLQKGQEENDKTSIGTSISDEEKLQAAVLAEPTAATEPWQVSLLNVFWLDWTKTCGDKQGTWKAEKDGSFSGPVPDDWSFRFSHGLTTPEITLWAEVMGSEWKDTAKSIAGKVTGAWVNFDDALTGVLGGALNGTFDPTLETWKAAASGIWIETKEFLKKVADSPDLNALQAQLNVPCIEIGRADLEGDGKDFDKKGDAMYVRMRDVTFFAYRTGDAPQIWATGDVSGTYEGNPQPGWTINNMKGKNLPNVPTLHADFKLQKWESGKWAADITKGRGEVAGHNVKFSGAAAGLITAPPVIDKSKTVTSGTFTGAGAGVVEP